MNIGQNILNLRKGANLSQEQLAEIIGVTRQTISNWELEESSPDLKQAKELSRFFNISLDDLTGDSTFEYLGGNNRENEITIISSVENAFASMMVSESAHDMNETNFVIEGPDNFYKNLGKYLKLSGESTVLTDYYESNNPFETIDGEPGLIGFNKILQRILTP